MQGRKRKQFFQECSLCPEKRVLIAFFFLSWRGNATSKQEDKTGTSAPGRAVPAARLGKNRAFREFTSLGVLLCVRRFADIYRASHRGEAVALQGTWDRVPQSPSR